jgi:hypothetical protein
MGAIFSVGMQRRGGSKCYHHGHVPGSPAADGGCGTGAQVEMRTGAADILSQSALNDYVATDSDSSSNSDLEFDMCEQRKKHGVTRFAGKIGLV